LFFPGVCPTQDEAVSPYHKLDIGDFVHRCTSQIGTRSIIWKRLEGVERGRAGKSSA
jgi:hypothetical protein